MAKAKSETQERINLLAALDCLSTATRASFNLDALAGPRMAVKRQQLMALLTGAAKLPPQSKAGLTALTHTFYAAVSVQMGKGCGAAQAAEFSALAAGLLAARAGKDTPRQAEKPTEKITAKAPAPTAGTDGDGVPVARIHLHKLVKAAQKAGKGTEAAGAVYADVFAQGDVSFVVDGRDVCLTLSAGPYGYRGGILDGLDSITWERLARVNGLPAKPLSRDLLKPVLQGIIQEAFFRDVEGPMGQPAPYTSAAATMAQQVRVADYLRAHEVFAKEQALVGEKMRLVGQQNIRKAQAAPRSPAHTALVKENKAKEKSHQTSKPSKQTKTGTGHDLATAQWSDPAARQKLIDGLKRVNALKKAVIAAGIAWDSKTMRLLTIEQIVAAHGNKGAKA